MNKRYYKLKKRLKHTQDWMEHFLEVEKNRAISKKARKALNRDKPFLGLIFIILYLPTRITSFISDTIWWNRYRKCGKEVELIKKEIESYE
tara:strand:- start:50 stop:322 length:273 start_codon:yes stop_codon:yes gene_type:complete